MLVLLVLLESVCRQVLVLVFVEWQVLVLRCMVLLEMMVVVVCVGGDI